MPNPKDLFHAASAVILLLSIGAGQVPTASLSAENGSKVWIGHYAEYEEFLRNSVVDRTVVIGQVFDEKELPVGAATRVFFKPGGLAASAAVKPHATKLEIAGYRLDGVWGWCRSCTKVHPTQACAGVGRQSSCQRIEKEVPPKRTETTGS